MEAWLNTFFHLFSSPGVTFGVTFLCHPKEVKVDSDKYLDFHEEGLEFLFNWIIPALIFIVLIVIGFHTYFITVGG